VGNCSKKVIGETGSLKGGLRRSLLSPRKKQEEQSSLKKGINEKRWFKKRRKYGSPDSIMRREVLASLNLRRHAQSIPQTPNRGRKFPAEVQNGKEKECRGEPGKAAEKKGKEQKTCTRVAQRKPPGAKKNAKGGGDPRGGEEEIEKKGRVVPTRLWAGGAVQVDRQRGNEEKVLLPG